MSDSAELRKTLDLLHEIASKPIPTGPVPLSREYLDRVARVERLPSNADGVDKSWVWEVLEEDRLHLEKARASRKRA